MRLLPQLAYGSRGATNMAALRRTCETPPSLGRRRGSLRGRPSYANLWRFVLRQAYYVERYGPTRLMKMAPITQDIIPTTCRDTC